MKKLLWVAPDERVEGVAMDMFDEVYGKGHRVFAYDAISALVTEKIDGVYIANMNIAVDSISPDKARSSRNAKNGLGLIEHYKSQGSEIPVGFSTFDKEQISKCSRFGGVQIPNFLNPLDKARSIGSLLELEENPDFEG